MTHFRRTWSVVVGGKTMALLVAEAFLVLGLLLATLAGGAAPSETIKTVLIVPAMLLVVLTSAEVVAELRSSGDLELAIASARPGRLIAHRMAPALVATVVQLAVFGLVLVFILGPVAVLVGWAASLVPVALTVATSLYWNLRLRSPLAVFGATFLSLVPAVIWIAQAHLLRESENLHLETHVILLSLLRCQLGLALATVMVTALALRRLDRTEELLDES
jgi:hypothetical protein